jgi:hypothetical protein
VGVAALAAFFAVLFGLPLLRSLTASQAIAMMDAFYRSGASVFGGGHVVLPLLLEAVVAPGWLGDDAFLAGYGAAQAVPGPLFTFAAYLGAVMQPPPNGLLGGVLGLVTIFLPGLLLHLGTLPFWESFRQRAGAQAVMRGINGAVVGLLGCGAVFADLDECGPWTARFRRGAGRVHPARGVEGPTGGRRRCERPWGSDLCPTVGRRPPVAVVADRPLSTPPAAGWSSPSDPLR